jgi:ankyrin repeat protein
MDKDKVIALLKSRDMARICAYFTVENVNARDWTWDATALHLACSSHVPDIGAVITHLLRCDASLIDAQDRDDWTALHWATAHGKHNCMRVLLARGAAMDAKTITGRTALDIAIMWSEHIQCIHLLLDYSAPHSESDYVYPFLVDRERARQVVTVLMGALWVKGMNRDLIPLMGQWVWSMRGQGERK